jgi:uncharacterized membrane protein
MLLMSTLRWILIIGLAVVILAVVYFGCGFWNENKR